MNYNFRFGPALDALDQLLYGAYLTLQLSMSTMIAGTALAVILCYVRMHGPRSTGFLIACYIEFFRNTPFLVQIMFIFFGLPVIGIRLSPNTAAFLAMVLNVTAYATEIIRAGIESIARGQVEAGESLGLSRMDIFRYIILKPAVRTVYPALTSQFLIVIMTSSVVSAISAQELTSIANQIQSLTFTSFEVYFIVTILYFVIYLIFTALFRIADRMLFSYPLGK